MKKMRITLLVVVSFVSMVCAQAITDETIKDMYSKDVKETFRIHIWTPPDYNANEPSGYGVIYQTDIWKINYVDNFQTGMTSKEIENAVVVGIDYIDSDINGETDRQRDLAERPDLFYKFIRYDLIPYIDSAYNTNNSRTLVGHSFGGYFSLYAFCQNRLNDFVFTSVVSASPSIWWNNYNINTYENSLSGSSKCLPVNLYLSVGSLEGTMVSDLRQFANRLISKKYTNFEMDTIVNPNMDHINNAQISFINGLKWCKRVSANNEANLLACSANTKVKDNIIQDQVSAWVADNKLFFSIENTNFVCDVQIKVFDTNVRLCKQAQKRAVEGQYLNFANEKPGMYIVQIIYAGRPYFQKVVK
jgi:enterochelin esterase-like enzyme